MRMGPAPGWLKPYRLEHDYSSRLVLERYDEFGWRAAAFGCEVIRDTPQEAIAALAQGLAEAGW